MKFPTRIHIKLATGNTIIVGLSNQTFNKYIGVFEATIRISKALIDEETIDDIITFETEEREEKMKDLLTGKQIQQLLGVSRQYFWQLKQRRKFPEPVFKEGRVELWNREDIERYIKNKK